MEQAWTPVAGPLEHNIARFISEGLLEEASLEEKIDSRYKAAEIKQMLEDRGIKAKGKKQEMITTLINSTTQAQAELLVPEVRMFRLTEQGNRKISEYRAAMEKAKAEMEAETITQLTRGDVRKAWARIARYYESQLTCDPRWTKPVPDIMACEATHLLKMPYDDLPLTVTQRKELGAHLALSVLLGEPFEDAGNRMMKYTGGVFDWTQVLAFHRPNPCGVNSQPEDAEALAVLYATTRIHEALTACELTSLKASRLGKGIKVLPVHGNDCHVCHSGKFAYAWSELEQLPRLPRQIGCHCTYAAWL
ncbi:SAP domain-containing protein [Methanocella sp. MCL-LM]|uniref:SAP domain-containing protein n=1 Tax=Methanocella sp. MCL-LM TaxID=3412035 RepID=UPI003C77E600